MKETGAIGKGAGILVTYRARPVRHPA